MSHERHMRSIDVCVMTGELEQGKNNHIVLYLKSSNT